MEEDYLSVPLEYVGEGHVFILTNILYHYIHGVYSTLAIALQEMEKLKGSGHSEDDLSIDALIVDGSTYDHIQAMKEYMP